MGISYVLSRTAVVNTSSVKHIYVAGKTHAISLESTFFHPFLPLATECWFLYRIPFGKILGLLFKKLYVVFF